eukprot:6166989-Heterocapsa_arctica.AAC.1
MRDMEKILTPRKPKTVISQCRVSARFLLCVVPDTLCSTALWRLWKDSLISAKKDLETLTEEQLGRCPSEDHRS